MNQNNRSSLTGQNNYNHNNNNNNRNMENYNKLNKLLLCSKCQKAPLPWNDPYECINCGIIYCVKCSSNNFSCVRCCKKSLKTSKLAKRILGNKLIACKYCHVNDIIYKTLPDHAKSCPNWEFSCSQPHCGWKGKQMDFIKHIQLSHEREIVNYFNKDSVYNKRYGGDNMEDPYSNTNMKNFSNNFSNMRMSNSIQTKGGRNDNVAHDNLYGEENKGKECNIY